MIWDRHFPSAWAISFTLKRTDTRTCFIPQGRHTASIRRWVTRYQEVKRQYTLFKGAEWWWNGRRGCFFWRSSWRRWEAPSFLTRFLEEGKRKPPLFALGYVLLGRSIYKAGWGQDLFFSMINCSMMFLIDFAAYCMILLFQRECGNRSTEGEIW